MFSEGSVGACRGHKPASLENVLAAPKTDMAAACHFNIQSVFLHSPFHGGLEGVRAGGRPEGAAPGVHDELAQVGDFDLHLTSGDSRATVREEHRVIR